MLVTLPQFEGDPQPLALIPDTGADGLMLFPRARTKVLLKPLEVGMVSGLAGSRLAHRVQLDDLVVGDSRLRNPLAVVVDDASGDLMGDGLLPLHVFSRVTFNVAGRFLIVQ